MKAIHTDLPTLNRIIPSKSLTILKNYLGIEANKRYNIINNTKKEDLR